MKHSKKGSKADNAMLWDRRDIGEKDHPFVLLCIECGDELIVEFERDARCKCGFSIALSGHRVKRHSIS